MVGPAHLPKGIRTVSLSGVGRTLRVCSLPTACCLPAFLPKVSRKACATNMLDPPGTRVARGPQHPTPPIHFKAPDQYKAGTCSTHGPHQPQRVHPRCWTWIHSFRGAPKGLQEWGEGRACSSTGPSPTRHPHPHPIPRSAFGIAMEQYCWLDPDTQPSYLLPLHSAPYFLVPASVALSLLYGYLCHRNFPGSKVASPFVTLQRFPPAPAFSPLPCPDAPLRRTSRPTRSRSSPSHRSDTGASLRTCSMT